MRSNFLPVSSYPPAVKGIFGVYSICLLAGTSTHVIALLRHGLLAFPVPLIIGVFWDSLTVLDPLAVALLWWRPKAGLRLTLGIMVLDICINTSTYLAGCFGPPMPNMVPLTLFDQALFGLFVFITAPLTYQQLQKAYRERTVSAQTQAT